MVKYFNMCVQGPSWLTDLHGSGASVLPTDAVSIVGPHQLVGGEHRSAQVLVKWNYPQLLQLHTHTHTDTLCSHKLTHESTPCCYNYTSLIKKFPYRVTLSSIHLVHILLTERRSLTTD